MSAPLLTLMGEARQLGLRLSRDGLLLVVERPRAAVELAAALLDRKAEVLELLDVYNGTAAALDWHAASWTTPAPCRACQHPARLRDPYDGLPWHKTCAEAAITEEQP